MTSHPIPPRGDTTPTFMTFAELVAFGREHAESRGTNGMPWSFKLNGVPVTHENDECYLVLTRAGMQRFTPRDRIQIGPIGQVVVLYGAPAASLPVEPAGTPEGTVSERFHQYLHDLLRAYAKSRSLPIGSGQAANEAGTALSLALVRVKNLFAEATTSAYTVTEATRALRAENTELSDRCAALTSEVSRLMEERENARRVHLARHARLSEAVGLPVEARFSADATVDAVVAQLAEVSALREAVDRLKCDRFGADPREFVEWVRRGMGVEAFDALPGLMQGRIREAWNAALDALRAARQEGK